MAELINLRAARKQANRLEDERKAALNRAAFGRPKSERNLTRARADLASRQFESHRIEREDGHEITRR